MAKKRKNIYFTDQQVARLEQKSRQEHLSEAEIVRRAWMPIWPGTTLPIAPQVPAATSERRSHPLHE